MYDSIMKAAVNNDSYQVHLIETRAGSNKEFLSAIEFFPNSIAAYDWLAKYEPFTIETDGKKITAKYLK